MKRSIIQIIKKIIHLGDVYKKTDYGQLGECSHVSATTTISNPKNVFLADHVQIGENAILFATNAKIIIKRYFISADGLKIATGQHERRIGRFLGSINESEKNHNIGLDQDVIINEDVWTGFNVCIMAGVEIGRGCTIAAGSVVTKSLPPYTVCAGVPAKPIKCYWSIDQILQHEKVLYDEKDRISREELETVFAIISASSSK